MSASGTALCQRHSVEALTLADHARRQTLAVTLNATRAMLNRDIIGGFIRMHVLHHAEYKPVFGIWLIEELREHGYKVGPGTLYPILHGLEEVGYLKSKFVLVGGRRRRIYEATTAGKRALARAKVKVKELHDELFEDHLDDAGRNPARRKVRAKG